MKTPEDALAASTGESTGHDRRREIRLIAPAGLRASLAELGVAVAVRDISLGGLAVTSTSALARDSVHVLRLTFGSMCVLTRARAAYCQRHDGRAWVVGFAFIPSPRPKGPTVEQLIDRIEASMISFG